MMGPTISMMTSKVDETVSGIAHATRFGLGQGRRRRTRRPETVCGFLRSIELFKKLTPSEIANVADRMHKRKYARGDVVIRQGDVGEEFFLIARGGASVTVQKPGAPERQIATLGPGDVFGEMALLTDEPRNATVSAVDDLE